MFATTGLVRFPWRALGLSAFSLGVSLLISTPAAAQQGGADASSEPDPVKEAAERYQRGLSIYAEGEYLLALVEFERAYQLSPDYRVLYNIGQVRVQLGRYAKAREALEQYLEKGGDAISAERKREVSADLEMLKQRTARLNIVTGEEGADLLVDGVIVGTSPLPEPIVVDAGEHNVEVRKVGFYGKSSQVTLAGRDDISVELELVRIPEKAPSQVVVERHTEREVAKPSSDRTMMWIGWAATGTLAIGAGVAGYFGITKANDLESRRTDFGVKAAELNDMKNDARTLFMIADVAGAAAVVVGGVSLYLTLAGTDEGATEKPKVKTGAVRAYVTPSSAGLVGSF